jgi:hypothetical protein
MSDPPKALPLKPARLPIKGARTIAESMPDFLYRAPVGKRHHNGNPKKNRKGKK